MIEDQYLDRFKTTDPKTAPNLWVSFHLFDYVIWNLHDFHLAVNQHTKEAIWSLSQEVRAQSRCQPQVAFSIRRGIVNAVPIRAQRQDHPSRTGCAILHLLQAEPKGVSS